MAYIIRVGRLGWLLDNGKIGGYADGIRIFANLREAQDKAIWIGGTVHLANLNCCR